MHSIAITRSLICAMRRPAMRWMISRPMKSTAPFRRYPGFMERFMKPPTGLLPPYLVSSVSEKTLVANSEERLQSVLATLEQCRTALIDSGSRETAQLVSVAILELRMKLNRIADSDLKALCDAMLPDEAPVDRSEQAKPQHTQRRRPLLKLVK